MTDNERIAAAINELVIANRILAHEDVMDASGHVSIRHPTKPDRYLISRSRSPQLVTHEDILELSLDSAPDAGERRPLYHERFIHGAVYKARPDVNAVVHAHAEDVLPFTVSKRPLRPVIGAASGIGPCAPVWDIREKFGDRTNLLVCNCAQGDDLAARLGQGTVALMRGHGFVVATKSLVTVTRLAIFLPRNARVYMNALRLGEEVDFLSEGEIAVKSATTAGDSNSQTRGWEYWAIRAGCGDLLVRGREGMSA